MVCLLIIGTVLFSCTVDCGACKGAGRPAAEPTVTAALVGES